MARKKRIVVDASVARSAGPAPVPDLLPGQCRAVLEAIIATGHRLVLSHEGFEEWTRHASDFSQRWLRDMFSRKLVLRIASRDEAMRLRLSRLPLSEREHRDLAKDIHLAEAALATDRVVISRDEVVRALFYQACGQIRELRQISWANPEIEDEAVADWVREGARAEAKRQLGSNRT